MSTIEKMDVDVAEPELASATAATINEEPACAHDHLAQVTPGDRRPSRLKDVQPRELCQMKNGRELIWTMLGAVEGTNSSLYLSSRRGYVSSRLLSICSP